MSKTTKYLSLKNLDKMYFSILIKLIYNKLILYGLEKTCKLSVEKSINDIKTFQVSYYVEKDFISISSHCWSTISDFVEKTKFGFFFSFLEKS